MNKHFAETGLKLVLLPVALLLLVACGGGGQPTVSDPTPTGLISGRLILPIQINSLSLQHTQAESAAGPASLAPIVPGEVLIGFDRSLDLSTASLSTLNVGDVQLTLQGGADPAGYHRYAAADLDEGQTHALVAELNQREDVAEAIPNWILSAFRLPNDPFAYLQWHYPALNLPAAWDIETGASNRITVAVVDSGGITDPNLHPDLSFVGGYNFVVGANNGGPNPNMSPDYMDYSHMHPQYQLGGGSGWHGLHVAGTIGANTDNGIGLAGVNWNVDLVAVRSMGIDGSGTLESIYGGAWWAAGGPVEGVPTNPNPARVVNMSLGGDIGGPCPQGIADMFLAMAANGVITVVAAGNETMSTATILPANCPGVITVGATDDTGGRAFYSNFGSEVDVMAPGGDVVNRTITDSTTGQVHPAGVLSTVLQHAGGASPLEPGSAFLNGTSMAAPHIAGIVSLMLARDPSLTFDQVVNQLRSAGKPLTAEQCSAGNPQVNHPSFCGSGIVDSVRALGGPQSQPGPGQPAPNPPLEPPAPGQPITTGDVYVAALFTNADGSFDEARSVELTMPASAGTQLNYVLSNLQPGNYTVAAWQPLGSTDQINPGDPFAMHPQLISIAGGQQVTNLDLHLQPFAGAAGQAQELSRLLLGLPD